MLLVLSVTELILWPGWGRLVTGLKIRWRSPWRIVNYDLHKVGGILAIVFLVLIASTGVAMSYWDLDKVEFRVETRATVLNPDQVLCSGLFSPLL
jgi:uncharacterized iron-regulated membrane protein